MNDIEIIDNFLDSSVFEELKNKMYSKQMFWSYSSILTTDNFIEILCNDLDNHIMTHLMYDQFCPLSDCFYWMKPIFDSTKMNIKALVRVRANLYLRTNEKIVHGYHTDFPFECKTAVFYLNSNDGLTKFENGQEVESVENRMVIFDGSTKHTGTTCTNQRIRMNINFNYF